MNGQPMDPYVAALLQKMMAKVTEQKNEPSPDDQMAMRLGAADSLGPDGLKEHIATNTFGRRGQLAREAYGQEAGQMQGDVERGQALQDKRFGNNGSALGNVLGGFGDVLNSFRGGMMEGKAKSGMAEALERYRNGQSGLLDREDSANTSFAQSQNEALRRYLEQQRQAQQPAQPQAPYYIAKP